MSDQKSRKGGVAEVDNTREARKAQKFLSVWDQSIGSVKSKGTGNLGSIRDGSKSLFGQTKLPDVLRRQKRLKELVDANAGDERFTVCVGVAKDKWTDLDKQLKTEKKPDLTKLYEQAGDATDTLLHAMETLGKAEKQGAIAAPGAKKTIDEIERRLGEDKMTDQQRVAFTKRLSSVKKGLIATGLAEKTDIVKTANEVDIAAMGLLKDLNGIVQGHTKETKKLLTRHTELSKRFSAPSKEDKLDQRVKVQLLLQQGEIAISGCKYEEATKRLDLAEQGLKALDSPSIDEMGNKFGPEKVLLNLKKERDAWANVLKAEPYVSLYKLSTVGGMPEGVVSLWQKAVGLRGECVRELETIDFMLANAPESAIAAQRLLDTASKMREEAVALFKDVDDYATDVEKGGTPGRVKELDEARDSIARRVDELKKRCTEFYKSVDGKSKTEGSIVTKLAMVEKDLAEARKKAVTVGDIGTEDFLERIAELAEELETTREQVKDGSLQPEDLAFKQQVLAYRSAIADLKEAASAALGANSDAAIKLKLSTAPAVMEKDGEALIALQETNRGATEDVETRTTELLVRTKQVSELAGKARGVVGATPEALDLERKQCTELAAKYAKRIEQVVQVLKGKLFHTDEINALINFGAALQTDLDTLMSPVASKDMSVLTDVSGALMKFETRIEVYESRGAGKKGDKSLSKFGQVAATAQELQDELGHSLFAPRQDEIKDLVKGVKDIADAFDQLDPDQSLKTLADLEKKIGNAKTKASKEHEEAEKTCKEITVKRKEVDVALKKEQKLPATRTDKYEAYYEDLIWRFRQLKLDIRAVDKLDGTEKVTYDQIIIEAGKAIARDPATCTKGMGDAVTRNDGVDEAKERLVELREVNLRLLKEKAAKMPKHEQTELNKQIGEMGKSISTALKTLEDKRDPAAVKDVTDSIERRLQRMEDSPLGNSTRGRNNLPDVEKRWKKAVALMGRALDRLPGEVAAVGGAADEVTSATKTLREKLAEVKDLFRPDAFSAVSKRMALTQKDPTDVAAAREDGLREVRRIKRLLEAHPILARLIRPQFPFDKPVLPIAELNAALWEVETNLSISG